MKAQYSTYMVLLALCVAACRPPVNVLNAEASEDFNLSDYQTFDFYEVDIDNDSVSQAYMDRVEILKSEITEKFTELGLTQSPSDPDLLVNLGIVVEDKVQTRETTIQEAPIYIGQRRYHWEREEVVVGRYQEGMVSVHLVDRAKNELVWEGEAEGIVPDDNDKLRRRIDQGVDELFSRIPGAGKSM